MVETFTGESLDAAELGGVGIHAASTGVAALVVPDREVALAALSDILAYLPSSIDEEPPTWWTDDPVDRLTPEAGEHIPASSTGGYDVRAVARALVDDGDLLALRAQLAPNLVTAMATHGRRAVRIVAHPPVPPAGTPAIPHSPNTARFADRLYP